MQFLAVINDDYSSVQSPEVSYAFLFVMFAVFAVTYAFCAWSLGKVFEKMGEESWKAWVPIYNSVILFQKGEQNPLWLILMVVPLVNIVPVVFLMLAVHKINEDFGKDVLYTVVYFFVPIAWSLMLGLGDAKYRGGQPHRVTR